MPNVSLSVAVLLHASLNTDLDMRDYLTQCMFPVLPLRTTNSEILIRNRLRVRAPERCHHNRWLEEQANTSHSHGRIQMAGRGRPASRFTVYPLWVSVIPEILLKTDHV